MTHVESTTPVDSPIPIMVLLEGFGPHGSPVDEDEGFGSEVQTGIGGVNSGVDV